MTTWEEPFEVRRLLCKFTRTPSGGLNEDVDVITFHLAKLTGGAIDAGWLAADYAAVEARLDTWWGVQKQYHRATTSLTEYRWYKDGPVFSPADRANGPANPAVRLTARAVVGTDPSSNQMPPQVAVSVTEVTSIRKRWGRFYLPAPVVTGADTDGRIGTAFVNAWHAPLLALYNGCKADDRPMVVFSRGRSAYVTRRGVAIAAHPASAYTVDTLQIDNLWDVMRSRRYSGPTFRKTVALT